MQTDPVYVLRLFELQAMASDLLGIRFHHGSRNYQTHIGARFIWIDRLNLEGDTRGRDAEIVKLYFLFKHLQELSQNHPEAYARVRKTIRKAPNEAQYFGARMEVYVAASLVRAGVAFQCRESPDYEILGNRKKVFIECGSAHIAGKSTDTIKKISLAVSAKCKKKYANRSTALFLDATNPMLKGLDNDIPDPTSVLRNSIQEVIKVGGYGSVLLLFYGFNEPVNKISANYIRIDSPEIDSELRACMDKTYPVGRPSDPIVYFPDQG